MRFEWAKFILITTSIQFILENYNKFIHTRIAVKANHNFFVRIIFFWYLITWSTWTCNHHHHSIRVSLLHVVKVREADNNEYLQQNIKGVNVKPVQLTRQRHSEKKHASEKSCWQHLLLFMMRHKIRVSLAFKFVRLNAYEEKMNRKEANIAKWNYNIFTDKYVA